MLEKRLYQEHPPRHEYRLTEKGLDLWPTIVALMHWGDRHATPPAGPPVIIEHRGCGGTVDEHRICRTCGARVEVRDAVGRPGPGASPDHPLVRKAERERATAGSAAGAARRAAFQGRGPASRRSASAGASRATRERGTT